MSDERKQALELLNQDAKERATACEIEFKALVKDLLERYNCEMEVLYIISSHKGSGISFNFIPNPIKE